MRELAERLKQCRHIDSDSVGFHPPKRRRAFDDFAGAEDHPMVSVRLGFEVSKLMLRALARAHDWEVERDEPGESVDNFSFIHGDTKMHVVVSRRAGGHALTTVTVHGPDLTASQRGRIQRFIERLAKRDFQLRAMPTS